MIFHFPNGSSITWGRYREKIEDLFKGSLSKSKIRVCLDMVIFPAGEFEWVKVQKRFEDWGSDTWHCFEAEVWKVMVLG